MPQIHLRQPAAVRGPRATRVVRGRPAGGARAAPPRAVRGGRARAGGRADAPQLPQAVHVAGRRQARGLPRRGRGGDGAADDGRQGRKQVCEPRRHRAEPSRRTDDLDERYGLCHQRGESCCKTKNQNTHEFIEHGPYLGGDSRPPFCGLVH